jgi:hypothetical protein
VSQSQAKRMRKEARKQARKVGRKFAGEFVESGVLFRFRLRSFFLYVTGRKARAAEVYNRGIYFLRKPDDAVSADPRR